MRTICRCLLVLLLAACGSGSAAAPDTAKIALAPVFTGVAQPTDIQFAVTGGTTTAVVLSQTGTATWFSADGNARGTAFSVAVKAGGELGLLGLALHPEFGRNGRFFVSYTAPGGTAARSRVAEYAAPGADLRSGRARHVKTLLEVDQPYSNHNGGQIQFGPDGFLYLGLGDGGAGGDPENRAQNGAELLGKILRLDVSGADAGLAYRIPAGNPFRGRAGFRPEIYALGLRNPWRFSFTPDGRLVAADVGQSRYEELDFVTAGGNYGWRVREGMHCYKPPEGCDASGLTDPFYEYSHAAGNSITGGYVYTGARIPWLRGKYVFADLSGVIWALDLPAAPGAKAAGAHELVRGRYMFTTFGRDPQGELYVGDFKSSTVYRLEGK